MADPGMAKHGLEVDQRSPKQLSPTIQIARPTPTSGTVESGGPIVAMLDILLFKQPSDSVPV